MKLIGVCGHSGSGKSTYCRKLNKNAEYILIDVDKIVHELLTEKKVKNDICELLKTTIFLENDIINRKKLGAILVADNQLMDLYNKLIWKYIEPKIDNILKEASKDIIIDWMFLPITKYFKMCDKKVLIKMDKENRKKTATKRDNVSSEYYKKRDDVAIKYNESDFDEIINIEFKNRAFFAGSFDPFTLGHLDIISQAAKDFDMVIIGIGVNESKTRKFDKQEMRTAILETTREAGIDNVDCVVYCEWTCEKAMELDCFTLIRGIRNKTDKQYEEKVADYNKEHFNLDTVYYYPSNDEIADISSTKVRLGNLEIVSKAVLNLIKEK